MPIEAIIQLLNYGTLSTQIELLSKPTISDFTISQQFECTGKSNAVCYYSDHNYSSRP